jgi:ABC-type multidrug transport system fused ATPase/permease subunit
MSIGETFSRSWELTKQTFSVIRKDKHILIFPFLASFFSIIFFLLMVVPFLMTGIVEAVFGEQLGEAALYFIIFILYLGISFIATFFNVAVVYTAKKSFEGGKPTFGEALSEAIKRIHLIFLWAMVSATVGLLLRILENAARNTKSQMGRLMMQAILSILGLAWSIVSLFVIPAIVFKNIGPFQALKSSVSTVKKTWGESLIRHYGLGMAQTLFVIGGAVLILVPGFLLLSVIPMLGLIIMAVFGIYLIIITLLFSTANTVFNTALYMYAEQGKTPKAYSHETMKHAFVREKRMPSI